MGMERFEEIN